MHPIETPRLMLRELVDDDAAFIFKLVNDPSWLRYIGDKGVRDMDGARAYIANGPHASYARFGFGLLRVELKADGTPIGMCGLIKRDTLDDVDIGYALLPQFGGLGYAREAADATLCHARDVLQLARLVALVSPDNQASIKLLEKLGLRFEKTLSVSADGMETALYGRSLQTGKQEA
ncbi:MAG: GNAT family N-acetyltransferase [Dokdonella sp.]